MRYIYLLESIADRDRRYVGLTANLKSRLGAHNAGRSIHTSKHKPWVLVAFFAFRSDGRAIVFEKYLKSGSGRAFAKKHLW